MATRRLPKRITLAWLHRRGAYGSCDDTFTSLFPNGAPITLSAAMRADDADLDALWVAVRLLTNKEIREFIVFTLRQRQRHVARVLKKAELTGIAEAIAELDFTDLDKAKKELDAAEDAAWAAAWTATWDARIVSRVVVRNARDASVVAAVRDAAWDASDAAAASAARALVWEAAWDERDTIRADAWAAAWAARIAAEATRKAASNTPSPTTSTATRNEQLEWIAAKLGLTEPVA